MTSFFTLFLIDDNSVLKENKKCLLKETVFISSHCTRIADIKGNTVKWLQFGQTYTLPVCGWLISPYTTYHEEHLYYVKHFKGNLPYDMTCFLVDVANERINKIETQNPGDVYMKNRWLRQIGIVRWVDSVLDDWVVHYSH